MIELLHILHVYSGHKNWCALAHIVFCGECQSRTIRLLQNLILFGYIENN